MNGQSLFSWSVVRDSNGRITGKTETFSDGTTAAYEYDYDAVGRLLTVTKDGAVAESYQYDSRPYGTRTYEERYGIGRSLNYNDEDNLLTAGDTTYQHDADGFLVSKTEGTQVTTYDYSLRGELLSVTLPDGTLIEYVHDPLGRRIAKKVNGVITEKYLWQGLTRLLAVYDGADNLLMRFEYADARMPVAMTKAGVTYYLAYDQVGSLKAVANASGSVVKKVEYDAFGNILSDSNPGFAVPSGFAGGLHDKDTGLVRFGYRDYDPETGRWTAKDPILFAGGDTDLYGYCVNDPVNRTDSEGLAGGRRPNYRVPPSHRCKPSATPKISDTKVKPQNNAAPQITPDNYKSKGINNLPGQKIPESPNVSKNKKGISAIISALNNMLKVFNMGSGGAPIILFINPCGADPCSPECQMIFPDSFHPCTY